MAIVPTNLNEHSTHRSAVTLSHYAKTVKYNECAVYGVSNPAANTGINACRDIWTLAERNYALRYFAEAQIELENYTKQLFNTTWVTGQLDSPAERLTDVKNYKRGDFRLPSVMYTRWNNVKALGRLVPEEVELAVTVSHLTDPATITVTIDPLLVVDVHKLRVFEAGNWGTDKEISLDPSAINISGNTAVIEIPRCRMVKYDLRDNPPAGLNYNTLTNFIEEVDVYYYTTVNEESLVLTRANCTCNTSQTTGCLEFTTVGLTTVKAGGRCSIDNRPCGCYSDTIYAGLYYEAGDSVVNQQIIDMIIRLAHVKMPEEPCGCELAKQLWQDDHKIPDFILPEFLKNPFGISIGAWTVFQWAMGYNKPKFGHG